MKARLCTLLLIIISFPVFSQTDDVYKKIAKETCECVAKRNIDTSKRNEVEMAMGLCMLESAQAQDVEIDISNDASMEKLGERVGLHMAGICPDLFKVFMDDEEVEEIIEATELTGQVKSIESGEFLYLIFKENSGKEHKLLWLRYFAGSDDFKEDPKKLIGKKMTISYIEMECYFPKLKAYYNAKEIVGLQLTN